MDGLKRRYFDEEGDKFTETEAATAKRRLVSTSACVFPCASSWITPSPASASGDGLYFEDTDQTFKSSSFTSSPNSADGFGTPSLTDNGGVHATSTPRSDLPEVADGSGSRVCFGMLVDGLLHLWKRSTISKISSSTSRKSTVLSPRFRADGITVLHPTLKEIGVLDSVMARGILLLQKSATSFCFEIYTSRGTQQDRVAENSSQVTLEILIYGQRSSLDHVGSLLSQSNLFLQEPTQYQLNVPYINPHVISWDDSPTSSYLLGPYLEDQSVLTDEINAILDHHSPSFQLLFEVEQDPRIETILEPHQLVALKFMIAREECLENVGLSLWKPQHRNGVSFFSNQITHSSQPARPDECRGGILADEMGMGKSLALLALVLHTSKSRIFHDVGNMCPENGAMESWSSATLIISPKSTISNWEEQISRHTLPNALRVYVYHGRRCDISHEKLCQYDIVLTTYETAANDVSISGKLSKISWLRIVLDEAHLIRNRSTKNFHEITKLRAERRWCLTGTPVQNRLSDLFSLTQFLNFHPLETHASARKYILEPLSRNDPQGLENLRLALHTISLRRARQACSTRQRSETVQSVTLNERERRLYVYTREQAKKLASLSTGKTQGDVILRAISTLRRICSSGSLKIPKSETCDKCGNEIPDYDNSQQLGHSTCGHSVCYDCIIKQNGDEGLDLNGIPDACSICQESVLPMPGVMQSDSDNYLSTTPMELDSNPMIPSTKYSSKIDKVVSNLRDIEDVSSSSGLDPIKSLVFSHWKETLNRLEEALLDEGMKYVRIDGSFTVEQRRTAINAFRCNSEIRVMLLSYGCGSVGLNLEVASYVHLLEPHWNPMIEAQAAARVDRLNQTKDIFIYRYIVEESIEENIRNTQRRKLHDVELSASRMASGESLDMSSNSVNPYLTYLSI